MLLGAKIWDWARSKKFDKVADMRLKCFLCLTFEAIKIRDLCKSQDNIPRGKPNAYFKKEVKYSFKIEHTIYVCKTLSFDELNSITDTCLIKTQ